MDHKQRRQENCYIGQSLPVPGNILSDVVQLTIRYIYNGKISTSLGEAWNHLKKSTIRLPTHKDSNDLKVARVNNQSYIWLARCLTLFFLSWWTKEKNIMKFIISAILDLILTLNEIRMMFKSRVLGNEKYIVMGIVLSYNYRK